MKDNLDFERAAIYLPPSIRGVLLKTPPELQRRVQEIRLRVNAPVVLSAPDGEWMVTVGGEAVLNGRDLLHSTTADVTGCFHLLCEHSVYAHQEELRNGYISTRNGCRAGVAGFAVVDKGEVLSVRNVTSVCIRVARRHDGCAARLAARLSENGRIHSALICGEPSSGKSSILKDLARIFSSGEALKRFRTSVVDERGELSFGGGLAECDVLLNCPKAVGIGQAVRCLAPDVVLFDELGSEDEIGAVTAGLYSGVAAITTAHCRDAAALMRRPGLMQAIRGGAFDYIVMLEGRQAPGVVSRIIPVAEMVK